MQPTPHLRHLPTLPYKGLTVILSHPSRFDNESRRLISGTVGNYFDKILRDEAASRYNMDVRVHSDTTAFLPGTKVVLLCGSACLSRIAHLVNSEVSLDEIRGYNYTDRATGITYIATYFPQDTFDMKNFERTLNTAAPDYVAAGGGEDNEPDDTDSDDAHDTKTHGKTSRKNYKFWFSADVKKALRILRNPQLLVEKPCNMHIIPFVDDVITALRNWPAERKLFFDIETIPETQQMTCFSFGDADEVYAVPLIKPGGAPYYYSKQATLEIMRELCNAWQRSGVVIHNAMFDLFITTWKYKLPPPPQDKIECTMIMQHRAFPESEKSLGHCVAFHTYQGYHKNSSGTFNPHNESQLRQLLLYNAKDVHTLSLVYNGLQQLAASTTGLASSYQQANSSIRPYILLILRGLRMDDDHVCEYIDETKAKVKLLENRVLAKLVGHNLNPRSPKQVATYLYEELCLKKPSSDITGKKALYSILLKRDIPAVRFILTLRGMTKAASALAFLRWKTNRVTGAYIVTGTDTLRLASRSLLSNKKSKPQFKGFGTNLQNWNKANRKFVVPDSEELVFVQCDQAGAEALIVAYECAPGNFRSLFENGVKPHVFVALHLFQEQFEAELGFKLTDYVTCSIPELRNLSRWKEVVNVIKASDNWPATRRYYFMGKQTCHSSNYDVGAGAFAMNMLDKSEGKISLTMAQAAKFLGVYHKLFPEIRQWHAECLERVRKSNGYLRNLFGYPRFFNGSPMDDRVKKQMYAFVPQSTVGSITNIAITKLQGEIDSGVHMAKPFAVMQNNHDSILAQCTPENATYVARQLCNALNMNLVSTRGDHFKMKSEASVGKNWKEMKEINDY